MQIKFPTGEYLRTLRILKSDQEVWRLDGVHVDTTSLQIPAKVEPPFVFQVVEEGEVVYSVAYDKDGEEVESSEVEEDVFDKVVVDDEVEAVVESSEVEDDVPDDA